MEKLESANVSLEFQVQSLIKERDNVKTEYKKLYNSIKKTRTQTQEEINELIEHVNQKTHDYAAVRAQNQYLLITISELKAKLKNLLLVLIRRPSNKDSSFKNSILSNTKNSSEKVEVFDRSHNKPDVASKNVALDKKIVTNDDIKNALIAKNVLRALFTTPRAVKSTFKDTTLVVSKTRFFVKITQSKSLDTTHVVSKTKIAAVTPLSAQNKVIQIVSWIVDSGCSKHMTGDRSLLKNFVEKFMGTVRFRNDHFAAITGYIDYVQGNITVFICFSFKNMLCAKSGYDLLTGDHESNLYTISVSDMVASLPVCLMSKATSTKSWLWHRRLSHLNCGTINDLTKHDLVDGLLKFKYSKDHLCSACERGKSKKAPHPPKMVPSSHSKLELLHMDLYGPVRVASINGNKHNKTPYELLRGRKLNVKYFHVFGSLCYPTNNRDDLGKMKPKADIGIFIGYSETSKGFQIYNQRTKKIMETIHVKFDELTAMASKHDSLEPVSQQFINDDSSAESMNTPSKEDLDNLFDSPLISSIIIEENQAPPIVTSSEEQTSQISVNEADEFYQEDSAELDGNTLLTLYDALDFSEAESSTALDPSNMHEFHQVQPLTHIWTKAHPLEKVIGDPSKPVMTKKRLQTDPEVYMYALTISTIEPKNIKEAMSNHSWIESMQDDLHQFERLDVWELVPRPDGKNIIAVKWIWKNKSDAKNIVIRNKSRLITKGYK
ncbi:gag-pol polyprotein [Tanacetum coccineum]|uniref:Gag-pol polyprotein n=1 Tax=Tanacetum coccineum TaxID=301880 RepID=A0ABQ4XH83_9ASTR